MDVKVGSEVVYLNADDEEIIGEVRQVICNSLGKISALLIDGKALVNIDKIIDVISPKIDLPLPIPSISEPEPPPKPKPTPKPKPQQDNFKTIFTKDPVENLRDVMDILSSGIRSGNLPKETVELLQQTYKLYAQLKLDNR